MQQIQTGIYLNMWDVISKEDIILPNSYNQLSFFYCRNFISSFFYFLPQAKFCLQSFRFKKRPYPFNNRDPERDLFPKLFPGFYVTKSSVI